MSCTQDKMRTLITLIFVFSVLLSYSQQETDSLRKVCVEKWKLQRLINDAFLLRECNSAIGEAESLINLYDSIHRKQREIISVTSARETELRNVINNQEKLIESLNQQLNAEKKKQRKRAAVFIILLAAALIS